MGLGGWDFRWMVGGVRCCCSEVVGADLLLTSSALRARNCPGTNLRPPDDPIPFDVEVLLMGGARCAPWVDGGGSFST